MMRKIILSTILAVGFAATTTMAGENTGYLLQLASKQEMLSQNIMTAYKKGDRGTSALEVVDALKSGHLKLKSAIHNPEIDNLLVYLNYRLDDLKAVVKKPYSPKNAQLVAEISASLSEGSHYIARTLKHAS